MPGMHHARQPFCTTITSGCAAGLLLMLLPAILGAKPVAEKDAQVVARSWNSKPAKSLSSSPNAGEPVLVETGFDAATGQACYYIYNTNPGFVAVAADDTVTPVLFYAHEGAYTTANHPPAFDEMTSAFRAQILDSAAKGVAPKDVQEKWADLQAGKAREDKTLAVGQAPLLQTLWGQGSYYNAMCPRDYRGPSGRTLTGCVATAMAQIMKYHEWPTRGFSYWQYQSPYGLLKVNFGGHAYAFRDMPTGVLAKANGAVAKLMYHAGVSVDMEYGPYSSGAFPNYPVYGFYHFRYRNNMQFLWKSDYTSTDWQNLMKNELRNRRPIYYGGYGSGGHAFVLDGLDNFDAATPYYTVNWGWDGQLNGYYLLNVLSPGGNYFNTDQAAIINIVPDKPYTLQTLKSFNTQYSVFGTAQSVRTFRMFVPRGASQFNVTTTGGTGDADIFVRRLRAPTPETYEHYSAQAGNTEAITVNAPAAGWWYFTVVGYSAYNDLQVSCWFSL